MPTEAEEIIAKTLRRLLAASADHAQIDPPETYSDVFNGFEYFLPAVLRQVYDYWKYESLDGFFPTEFRKIGPYSAEAKGFCILISDQTVTPISVRLGISPSKDEIAWMDCKVGAKGEGPGGMIRLPYSTWRNNPRIATQTFKNPIDWSYKITFGHNTISTE